MGRAARFVLRAACTEDELPDGRHATLPARSNDRRKPDLHEETVQTPFSQRDERAPGILVQSLSHEPQAVSSSLRSRHCENDQECSEEEEKVAHLEAARLAERTGRRRLRA